MDTSSYIIDMHVHVAGLGSGSNCYVAPRLLKNWRYDIYLRAFETSEAELREQGDSLVFKRLQSRLSQSRYVDGLVLLALDQVYDRASGKPNHELTEVYIPNDFVRDGTRQHEEFHYGPSVHPYRPDWDEELERVKADGAILLKWLPAIQHIDPSEPRIKPFYRKLAELNLPLLTHTGAEKSFSKADPSLGDPRIVELALDEGVTVIAAHVATTGSRNGQAYIDRLLPMFAKHTNLYTDISSLTQINKAWYPGKVVAQENIHDRLLYGSDYPLINSGIGPFKLVSPWYFLRRIGLRRARQIAAIDNVWDRDVMLKKAIGFPTDCFIRPATLLNILPKALQS